jgi:TPP-dependent pyruvate/acetoin dehydrogenase alpha subunit
VIVSDRLAGLSAAIGIGIPAAVGNAVPLSWRNRSGRVAGGAIAGGGAAG